MSRLKVAFLGFGFQAASVHAKYIVEELRENVDIVGVYDIRKEDIDDARKKLRSFELRCEPIPISQGNPSDPNNIASVVQLLREHPNVDAVIVSTPNTKHFPQAKVCLKAGVHVLVDKPFAIHSAEAEELVWLAAARDALLMVASQRRYEPAYQYLKHAIEGELGGRIVTADSLISQDNEWMGGWRTDPVIAGGGAVRDLGWHTVDLIIYLVSDSLRTVDAQLFFVPGENLERQGSALLRFDTGLTVTMTINHLAPRNSVYERLYIAGLNGTIILDRTKPQRDTQQPSIVHQAVDGSVNIPDKYGTEAQKWAPTAAFFRHLIARKLSKSDLFVKDFPILTSGADSIPTVEAIDKMYSSHSVGQTVLVDSEVRSRGGLCK